MSALQPIEVVQGDDVRALAERYMGDFHRWRDLVEINGLEPPYITTPDEAAALRRSGRTVATIGDTLYAPVVTPVPLSTRAAEEAYGHDLVLEEGRLRVSGNDYAITTGLDNLAGALTRRLSTPLGGLPAHPRYGHTLKPYLGQAGDTRTLEVIVTELERAIRNDSRVERAQVEAVAQSDVVRVTSEVTPVAPADLTSAINPLTLLFEVPR